MLKNLSESSPYHANCTRPIPSQRLHQIQQSPVDIRVYRLMMSSPYSCTCIRPIQLETKPGLTSLVRPGNVFPFINSPMVVLSGPGEE
ncbi:hypothetical protein AVEN_166439-1 [Araneus ventricosus]|uniref:Uncharacterized protein n=1 Tax=Araneus ventricosus TaxID=182803 RepID=A0A4Y2EZN3_ARAVE|nr:hypothetical protein AVEN_166439-1 [Araneus ventricosus]